MTLTNTRKTKRQIIDEFLENIKKQGGRARRAEDGVQEYHMEENTCCYFLKTSNGVRKCAVGMFLKNPKRIEETFEANVESIFRIITQNPSSILDCNSFDDIFMESYKGHSCEFWTELQNLHDFDCNWKTETELSKKGLETLNAIKIKYSHE